MSTVAQERKPSEEEIKLQEQSAIAKYKKEIAEAELAEAKSRAEASKVSQGSSPTELEQATTNKSITEATRDAILAERAKWKGPDVTAPTGKITTNDGTFIETRVLAHQMLTKVLSGFVDGYKKKVNDNNKKITFVMYNQADIPSLELYAGMLAQLQQMKSEFQTANKRAATALALPLVLNATAQKMGDPLLVGYAAAGIIRTAADLVSLFRTTTDYKNFDVTFDETTTIAILKQSISAKALNWQVYNPAVFPVSTINAPLNSSPFMKLLNDIQGEVQTATDNLSQIEKKVKEVEEKIADSKTPADHKVKMKEYLKNFPNVLAALKALNASATQVQTSLNTADPQTKLTVQSLLLRAERLSTKLNQPDVYTLKMSATSRGSNKVTENLWRNARIKHTAGTELSCILFNADGEVSFAYSDYSYTPYTAAGDIK